MRIERDRTASTDQFPVIPERQTHLSAARRARAAWIADAVVYGVVPRNFDPPTFAGVADRLDVLADLGVTALWLAPITKTISGHYGYEVTDYCALRPEYGTTSDFKALVEAAHVRGLRVLMDFVPNHTSVEHPYFQDALADGESSADWDFYDRDDGGNPTHYFNWTHLPNLNYDNRDVQRFMLEAFSYWVHEFAVDGFRVDAVWGIKERNPEWLATFLAEMHRLKPEALIIAEASARDPFYFEIGFDAAYDWTEKLGHWAWSDIFSNGVPIGQALVDVLTAGGRGYHDNALVMRFLNNNDTGARFITTYGVDYYRVALAMLLTLPGLPCLFTGDEVGAEFQPYQQSGPIDWSDRHGMRDFTRKLIALRRKMPALHSPAWTPLKMAPANACLAYLRVAAGVESVIVLLNFSPNEQAATATLPEDVAASFAGCLTDLWSGESLPALTGNVLAIALPARGFRIVTND